MPSPAGPRALFIYYRVSQTRRAEAYAAITALQQTLMRRLPGVQARLWCRSDEHAADAPEQTWMEVYEHSEGVDALCEQVLLSLVQALPAGLIGPRHVESFVPMGSAVAPNCTSEA
ncbi:MAG: DUF4936 family protein [Aquabacterium sp.]|jgi:hypothetical protein|uniref:DUF4936 family protein n=1 Tax=Aquabacterium sp. TaxID=1872578 RepID=UPI002A358C88|nr:DUF4936 family protein [Aquabacterium sp.]MDX9842203.1 DUF4936 family protein [Aquabacterium sp.]